MNVRGEPTARAQALLSWRRIAAIAGAIIVVCVVAFAPAFAQDEDEAPTPEAWPSPTAQQIETGKADFNKHCAPCHGENAKGHGPELKVIPGIKPADLTRITANNGGVFPAQQIADTIDGRKKIPSHLRFDMPFWGVNFQEQGKEFTPQSEELAKKRIQGIVDYIETLQQQ